ncbi:hypothetical protein SAMN04489842_2423 [Natronobacterium texcoconense]|uniref:Uncharacterized protein n=1 Tax=Natronobacterium texcoconense TaxID=1095778 RepID=A0A1H1GHN0_NATTX|nr:hypothetical protein SAMN04489842_2423 [Natronobacterium texcoconense]
MFPQSLISLVKTKILDLVNFTYKFRHEMLVCFYVLKVFLSNQSSFFQ